MSLAGLILAAGASSRMGKPKALLPLAGRSFLACLVDALGSVCSPVVVVVGHDAEAVSAAAGAASVVRNPDPARGQLSSLQCGLRAVPANAEGVMFTPVDYPAIHAATIARLAEEFRREGALLVVPRHGGRRGHPVCCSRELIPEFLALPSDAQARDVVHRHLNQTHYVDVDDPGILHDVDDPAAYEKLIRSGPQ